MDEEKCVVSYTGEKCLSVVWCRGYDGSAVASEFLTGSEDGLVTKWCVQPDAEPEEVTDVQLSGSVTGMCFMSSTKLLCSSACGDVSLVSINPHEERMNIEQQWKKLHRYDSTGEVACCTGVTCYGQEIVSAGEDGKINVMLPDRKLPIRSVEDGANVTGVRYLTAGELASINSTGQLKLWDMRTDNGGQPQKVLTLTGNACPLLSLDNHPNQSHVVVTGHGDGVVGVWDTRQERAPVTLIEAHQSEVWQVRFHPVYADNLFTCSEDGTVWFWDGTGMMTGDKASSAWLSVDANKHKMETYSLLPSSRGAVNSFDVCASSLVCATDTEALMIVSDIPVR